MTLARFTPALRRRRPCDGLRRAALLVLAVLLAVVIPAQAPGRKIVVLDPGHGGDDNGARGPGGTFEKDAALLFASSLRRALKEAPGMEVILTREDDRRLSLEDRAVLANRTRPALFLSLHCASGRTAPFLVYHYQPSPEQAERYHVLTREVGGREVQLVLWDLAQFRWSAASKELAGALQVKLNVFHQQYSGAPVGYPLAPLAAINCPAVVLEFASLGGTDQEQRIQDPAWRDGCARAVRDALTEFIRTSQPIMVGN